jgi:hypothetical protein
VNGLALTAAAVDASEPAIVPDGAAGAYVAWTSDPAGSSNIYVQRATSSGTIAPGWPGDGLAICTATGFQSGTGIVTDGAGGAVVAWQDARVGTGNYDIYAPRVVPAGATAPGWTPNGVAACNAAQSQIAPTITTDQAGGAILAWIDARTEAAGVYAQHLTPGGLVFSGWPSNGLLLSATGLAGNPVAAPDGNDGAVVTWHDSRNGTFDVYAQRVTWYGYLGPGWPASGLKVCGAAGTQDIPAIAADNCGGAVIAWEDARSGGFDIYAQRLCGQAVVSVAHEPRVAAPSDLRLAAPRPNPSRGPVTIRFELPVPGPVDVTLFDISGRSIRKLLARAAMAAGPHSLVWDGRDDAGRPMGSQVYVVRVRSAEGVGARKIVLLR